MQIQFKQLLNLPDIQVLNVEITEREIKCDIESPHGCSICYRCGQKATKFRSKDSEKNHRQGDGPNCHGGGLYARSKEKARKVILRRP